MKLSVFKALGRVIPMVFLAFPLNYLCYILVTVIHGAAWGFTAPANQLLYDALTDAVAGNDRVNAVYLGAVAVTGVMLWQQLFNSVHNFMYGYLWDKAGGRLSSLIHLKSGKLPAQIFEDKSKLDDIEKAGQGKDGAIHLAQTFSDVVFFYGTYYVVVFGYLWSMKPALVFAFFFIFAPVALSQIVQARMYAKLEEVSAPIRRQYAHYEDCLVGRGKMKETRLFGAYHFFKKLYMDTVSLLAQKEWDVQKKIAAVDLGLNGVKAAGWVGVLALLFDALVKGEISVGSFAAVFSSVGMLFAIMEEVFNRIKWQVTQAIGKINNFLNFLDLPERQGGNTAPETDKGIVLTDVRFSYPQADTPAVDGVTLTVAPGETVALVGENGSGKTTLVKLLTGLYIPDSGSVVIGGKDTRDTSEGALFSRTSGVFQNYAAYAFTLRENVSVSQRMSYNEVADIIPALRDADVDYEKADTFPKGLDTVLSREFDGVDLSGGQWQRVAMARGLYREHDFIVLDEPTAAIDPIEETRVYKRFEEIAAGKTAVVVTHRLGSARIANRIIVMDKGRIIETGTHEQLAASGGKYAAMWAAQADYYVRRYGLKEEA
jgi:ATP-binding cassette subfamily B protein